MTTARPIAEDVRSPEMVEVLDAEQLAQAQAQRARFDLNAAWLQAHAGQVYSQHRGKCICVAGQELFVADTPQAALALARAAHLEDDGLFVRYISRDRVPRIYADRR